MNFPLPSIKRFPKPRHLYAKASPPFLEPSSRNPQEQKTPLYQPQWSFFPSWSLPGVTASNRTKPGEESIKAQGKLWTHSAIKACAVRSGEITQHKPLAWGRAPRPFPLLQLPSCRLTTSSLRPLITRRAVFFTWKRRGDQSPRKRAACQAISVGLLGSGERDSSVGRGCRSTPVR